MDLDFTGLGELDTPIAIEIFPDGRRWPNLVRGLRYLRLRDIKRRISELLAHDGGRYVWNDDVFVLENLRIRLPLTVYKNAGSPDRELFFARVQSKRIRRIPIPKLRPTPCNFHDFSHTGLCAVEAKLDRHGRVHFKML